MISNGKDKPLFASSLPDVGVFLLDWFQQMTFVRITKSVVNSELVEVPTTVQAQGVRQPMSAQSVSRKPEGQRAWKWQTLHTLPETILLIDDKVIFDGEPYRVAAKSDWKEYGYVQYDICEDYR